MWFYIIVLIMMITLLIDEILTKVKEKRTNMPKIRGSKSDAHLLFRIISTIIVVTFCCSQIIKHFQQS